MLMLRFRQRAADYFSLMLRHSLCTSLALASFRITEHFHFITPRRASRLRIDTPIAAG
jgi:hypothetical protein